MISDQAKQMKHIYAVGAGAQVSYSSCSSSNHVNYLLDYSLPGNIHAWCPKNVQTYEWIQVSRENPKRWVAIILQGRGDNYNEYVKSFKVSYTLDGYDWTFI